MDLLFNQGLEQHVQLGKVIGGQIVILGQLLGLQAKGTSGLTDIAIFNDDCEMLADTIATTRVLAVQEMDHLERIEFLVLVLL